MNKRAVYVTSIALSGIAALLLIAYFVFFAPVDVRANTQPFSVPKGQTISGAASDLAEQNIIRSPLGLRFAFVLTRVDQIKAGTYLVSPSYNAWEIAKIIGLDEPQSQNATIPEGYTVRQIGELLGEKFIVEESAFVNLAGNYPNPPTFFGHQLSENLEGYLFPDTYNLQQKSTPEEIISAMLTNFERRLNPLASDIEASDFNLHEIITLASLIEKEARKDEDRRLIAGVLLNRLENNMRLDVDATVRFIFNNWTDPITQAQLNSTSPYNTRRVAGLPPGPICNPGLAAIRAVLNPQASDYLYYLTDNDGVTHYARTLDEHNANKAQYLQ